MTRYRHHLCVALAATIASGWTKPGHATTEYAELLLASPAEDDLFGYSVSIAGDIAVIGAQRDDESFTNQGAAYVFVREMGVWTFEAQLLAPDPEEDAYFGSSVDITPANAAQEAAIVVGSMNKPAGSFARAGRVYVFRRNGTAWDPEISFDEGDAGGTAGEGHAFGAAVAISGHTLVVGAPGSGAAYVYRDWGTGAGFIPEAVLRPSDQTPGDYFGSAVDIDDDSIAYHEDMVIVGAPQHLHSYGTQPILTGSAYVFVRGNAWMEHELLPTDGADNDGFGGAVAIEEDYFANRSFTSSPVAVVGAKYHAVGTCVGTSGAHSGAAYAFVGNGYYWFDSSLWAKLTADTCERRFGGAISMDYQAGVHRIAIVQEGGDGNATESGAAYIYSGSPTSGFPPTLLDTLWASDGASGDAAAGGYGCIAVDQNRTIMGAPWHEHRRAPSNSGAAYVFE